MNSNRAWQTLGSTEPYFAVLTDKRFERADVPGPDRDAFFLAGETDVAQVLDDIRNRVTADFAPQRALDFGCGVGRLVVPLARRVTEVVGVDVSVGMIEEARRNVAEAHLDNVALLCSSHADYELTGTFDFIHSLIVFQHIPPRVGLAIARDLVAKLRPGGVAALHFVYAIRKPIWWRIAYTLRKGVPGLHALANVLRGHPAARPLMPMNVYSTPAMLELARSIGCRDVSMQLLDHDGFVGAMMLFQRPRP
jgi:SAM-dependent methyltransferase